MVLHTRNAVFEHVVAIIKEEGHRVVWSASEIDGAASALTTEGVDAVFVAVGLLRGSRGMVALRELASKAVVVAMYAGSSELDSVDVALAGGASLCIDLSGLAESRGRDLRARLQTVRKLRGALSLATSPVPRLIVMGASTGGPDALSAIFGALPADLPHSFVLVQHIEPDFMGALTDSLSASTSLRVEGAEEGAVPRAGVVQIAARPGMHLTIDRACRLHYVTEPSTSIHRPSIDVLFESVALHWPMPGIAILLTGMGADGARGMAGLQRAGFRTIAQSEGSCVVFGMPGAALASGAAREQLNLAEIARAIQIAR